MTIRWGAFSILAAPKFKSPQPRRHRADPGPEKGNRQMQMITLNINGRAMELTVSKNETLLSVLRERLNLTGTKCGCDTNDCGSCKVVIDGQAVNSCSVTASRLTGKSITTIEGLSDGEKLHPIQEAFVECGAVQCGYCTPGMIMTAKAFLDQNPEPTEEEVRKAIDKNLCRCTGYVKIVEAVLAASGKMRQAHG